MADRGTLKGYCRQADYDKEYVSVLQYTVIQENITEHCTS